MGLLSERVSSDFIGVPLGGFTVSAIVLAGGTSVLCGAAAALVMTLCSVEEELAAIW